MNRHYRLIALACAAFGWSIPSFSYADDPPTPSAAEALFNEGVTLLDNQRFAEACPKFEQSLALERRPGTLFALADCNAQSGRAVKAIETYNEYLRACEELPDEKKQKLESRMIEARSQIEALRPLVSAMTIVVPAAEGIGFSVVLVRGDRKLATKSAEIEVFPLEPGEHLGVVEVAGAMPKIFTVTLEKGEHRRQEVLVVFPKSSRGNFTAVQPVGSSGSAPSPDWIKSNVVIAGGLGVLGVGAVIAASVAGTTKDENFSKEEWYRLESLRVGFTYTAVTAFVGAAAVGGLTLKYALTGTKEAPKAKGPPEVAFRVVPTLGGVVVQGNWF